MAVVVIGGHSRNLGKTSVVAGLISALPEMNWTAVKVTQYGHGICSADGEACECATASHAAAVSEERDRSGHTDTSRFLLAGARRALWVRTQQGYLAEAMPRLRRELQAAENAILESNSILRFLRPDLYLPVLDFATADFKESARRYLDFADAFLLHSPEGQSPSWPDAPLKLLQGKPVFCIRHGEYVTPDVVEFVRGRVLRTA